MAFICSCSATNSKYASCGGVDGGDEVLRNVSSVDIAQHLDAMKPGVNPLPIWLNTLIMLAFFAVFRLLGYISLRFASRKTGT